MRAIEACPMAAVIINGGGLIQYLNRQALKLFGVDRGLLKDTQFRMVFAYPDQFDQLLASFYQKGSLVNLEREMRHLGASNFWATISAEETVFGNQPAVIFWFRDITSRKQSDEVLDKLFNTAPLPMLLCSFPEGIVRRSNRRAKELFIGGSDNDSFMVETIIGHRPWLQLSNKLRGVGFIDDYELVFNTAYGESFFGMVSGQFIDIGGENCILFGVTDITERKRSETTMLRFFDSAPLIMILVRHLGGQILRINRRASELFDAGGDAKAGTLDGFMGVVSRTLFYELLGGGGFVDNFESQVVTAYGEMFWANLSGQVMEVDGERCILIGVTDISDRKAADDMLRTAKEEAEQATQAKSLFLATMSHEIRTPMNGVLGMVDLLATSTMTVEQDEMVRVIGDSARTLMTIIDDILDLSKIEAGKLHLEMVSVHLGQLMESALALVTTRARDKNIEIAWIMDQNLPDWVFIDPVRLRQILLNLLGNAIKFTASGTVCLRVAVTGSDSGFMSVRFEIMDTGIGLSEEQQGRLFQAFMQADESTTRRFGGTGLGLSICRRLVEMMGGDIGVISKEGFGSTFWFEIPLKADEQPPSHNPTEFAGIKALVVDDVGLSRLSVQSLLSRVGAEAVVVATEKEFKAALKKHKRFDVALMDETLFSSEIGALVQNTVAEAQLIRLSNDLTLEGEVRKLTKPLFMHTMVRLVNEALGRVTVLNNKDENKGQPAKVAMSHDEALKSGQLILVAEDNPTNRLVISKQLTRLGYTFDIVEDGEIAWKALQEKPYGLLLTDCFMPNLDGFLLTERIRKQEKAAGGTTHLPVIALTANALRGDSDKCLDSGMDDYLAKPVALDKLDKALTSWMPKINGVGGLPSPEPTTPADSTALPSPIDFDALANVMGDNDPELFKEILEFFCESFEELHPRIESAVLAQDRIEIRQAAHAAKGASQNASAPVLAKLLFDLEHGAGSLTMDEITALLDQVTKEFGAVQHFVKTYPFSPLKA